MANRRAKGEGSIYKDNQGYWNAQIQIGFTPDGKIKYKKFRSRKQSIVVEKMNQYKLGIGTANQTTIQQSSLTDLLSSYMNIVKKISVRATSYDSLIISQKQIDSHIGHYLITDLTPESIQVNLINKMYEDGYAFSTIHKAYVLLNECINYAVNKNYILKNPCASVKLPSKDSFQKKEIRFLADDEITRFKQQATSKLRTINTPKYIYGNILCLIIYTGLRVSELAALQWQDVNFKTNTLTINKTVVVVYDHTVNPKKRTLILQPTTKSGKPRIVPLNKKAIEILETQKKVYGGDKSSFIVNGLSQIPDKTVISNAFSKIAKAAKIPNPSGIHTLRHTFASLAIRKGVDIKVVSEILGHASVSFTYNTYVHIIDQQKQNAVDLLNDI